jgi:hypothetical protein
MVAAFSRSIEAVISTASTADIDYFHAIVEDRIDTSVYPADPILAALAEAHWVPGQAVCRLLEEARGVHRDALMYVSAREMWLTLEWQDQAAFLLDALGKAGYPEVVESDWHAPLLYVDRLLARAMDRRLDT